MGKPVPEYTQEQINHLFAYILQVLCNIPLDDDMKTMLRYISEDWYVLNNKKDEI